MADVDAVDGDVYWFVVDGVGPLVDPNAMDVLWTTDGPLSVVRTTWPKQPTLGRHHPDPVVYEVHVRGFGTTFDGCTQRLPYIADLGVDVIELMPVHPFDSSTNYWGYMPVVWGAVHRPYADGNDAAAELAEFRGRVVPIGVRAVHRTPDDRHVAPVVVGVVEGVHGHQLDHVDAEVGDVRQTLRASVE